MGNTYGNIAFQRNITYSDTEPEHPATGDLWASTDAAESTPTPISTGYNSDYVVSNYTTYYTIGKLCYVDINAEITGISSGGVMLFSGLPKAKYTGNCCIGLSNGSTIRVRAITGNTTINVDGTVSTRGWYSGQLVYITE